MLLFLTVLHILLCLVLILVILLQPGKGADPGAAFGGGGGSSSIFGPRGPGNVLSRATTVVAFLFMVTSIGLAIYSNEAVREGSDVDEELQRLQQEADEAKQKEKLRRILDEDEAGPGTTAPPEILVPGDAPVEGDGAGTAAPPPSPEPPPTEAPGGTP